MAEIEISYSEMMSQIEKVYGTGGDAWAKVRLNVPVQGSDAAQLINNAGVNINYASSGNVSSYTIDSSLFTSSDAAGNIGNLPNSNLPTTSTLRGGKLLGSVKKVTESGQTFLQGENGVRSLATAAKHPGTFLIKEVAPAVAAAGVGIKLGKVIDSALYKANPTFWNEHGMSTLNPETWNNITADDTSLGSKLVNMVFGLNPETNTTQAYLDENAFAYLTGYMQDKGAFINGESYEIGNLPSEMFRNYNGIKEHLNQIKTANPLTSLSTNYGATFSISLSQYDGYYIAYKDRRVEYRDFISKKPFTITTIDSRSPDKPTYTTPDNNNSSFPDYPIYIGGLDSLFYVSSRVLPAGNYVYDYEKDSFEPSSHDVALVILYGLVQKAPDGLPNQPTPSGGTAPVVYNPEGVTANDTQSVLDALRKQYPELFDKAVYTEDYDPKTGENIRHIYLPIGMPNNVKDLKTDTQPTTNPDADTNKQNDSGLNPGTDPNTATQELLKWLIPAMSPVKVKNPSDTGKGDTPAVVIPAGTASALWTVYNPSQGEINSFGAWLWSDNFVDQLKKLFSDPMSAIIGLHKVFVNPPIGGRNNIKVGYLDSGVSANVVTGQYVTVNCGTVNLPEYFGNVLDYGTNTRVKCFLPFVGIVPLDTAEVMRSSLTVVYHVDVLTGACLAEIRVSRDGYTANLYTYSGNAAVQYPLSSGSYMGIVSGILSIAGGIAGTIASGGALTPALMGGMAGASRLHTDIQHSGSLAGNAGAMGGKIPYLIIERPQAYMANGFESFQGLPENRIVTLSECRGYTRTAVIHTDGIANATDAEKREIERLCNSGIII